MTRTAAPAPPLADLARARYARLRTHDRDGRAVDTPIWFVLEGTTLRFRTKRGPKTRRIAARPEVEITPCDHRGQVRDDAASLSGVATVLDGADAEAGDRALHDRYGWQWNLVPLLPIPGVVNVHRSLSWREKVRRARARSLWPDSAIVRVDLRG